MKKRDSKGRFVSKSADQVAAEVAAKKRKEEREKIEALTEEKPEEAIAEDAEPMQFETPKDGPTEDDERTGCAATVALLIVVLVSAAALWFLNQAVTA